MLALPSPLFSRLSCSALPGTLFVAAALCSTAARAADDRYKLRITGQEIAAGQSGQVKLSLTADEPWHMNTDFPTSVKLSPVAGVKIDEPKLKRGDARVLSEHKIVFIFDVSAQREGNFRVPGKIKFAICKNDSCSPASATFNLRIRSQATKAAEPLDPTPKQIEAKPKPEPRRKNKTRRPSRKGKKAVAPRPAAKAPKQAPSGPLLSPFALRYLDQWMLDPIWGPGLSQQLHQFLLD